MTMATTSTCRAPGCDRPVRRGKTGRLLKTCSEGCMWVLQRRGDDRPCIVCGVPVRRRESNGARTRTCSLECQAIRVKRLDRPRPIPPSCCRPGCGMPVQRHRQQWLKYCSAACRKERSGAMMRTLNAARFHKISQPSRKETR